MTMPLPPAVIALLGPDATPEKAAAAYSAGARWMLSVFPNPVSSAPEKSQAEDIWRTALAAAAIRLAELDSELEAFNEERRRVKHTQDPLGILTRRDKALAEYRSLCALANGATKP